MLAACIIRAIAPLIEHRVVWEMFTDVTEVLAALMIGAASTSETSINFYQTPRLNNPEDSHLKTDRVAYSLSWQAARYRLEFTVHVFIASYLTVFTQT
jgi:hypothetical protein